MATWFLWPVDVHPMTNRCLAQIVGAETENDTMNLKAGVRCADGVERNLYVCPHGYTDVKKAIVAQPEFALRFEAFMQRFDEKPTRFVLWKASVRKRAKIGKQEARIWHKRPRTKSRVLKAK